jgi:hypothetical protein
LGYDSIMKIIGIDPGKSGSICRIDSDEALLDLRPMPDEDALLDLLREWCTWADWVFIEAIPKFAGENRSAAFMSVLYGNYKFCVGAVRMHGHAKLMELPPLKWMNLWIPMDERSRDRTERKRQLLQVCAEYWPKHKIKLALADSPLIALAGKHLVSTVKKP